MKKTYLKPSVKRVEVVEELPLMDATMEVYDKPGDQDVSEFEDLLGNSVNVWEE